MMRTIESYIQDDDRPYESTLYLDSVTYEHVGFYYCVKNSSITAEISEMAQEIGKEEIIFDELFEDGYVARIYLFVEGMSL